MNTTKHLPAYFTQIDYNTRKFIFVLGTEKQLPGCYDKDGNIQCVFTLNDLPTSIQFPVGHPQANTLYIGHPFKPATYLPLRMQQSSCLWKEYMNFVIWDNVLELMK